MVYKTKGTCSSEIEFEVENGILTDIHFVGGCQGNTTGVAALAKGLPLMKLSTNYLEFSVVSVELLVQTSFLKH